VDEQLVEETLCREQRRIIFRECRAKLGAVRSLVQQGAAGVDDDGFARAAPDGEVGGRIAGVIKAAFAEFLQERLELVSAAHVGLAVAAKKFIEQAGVIGNRFRHPQIGRGGENDFPPGGFLFAEKFQKRFVIGQGGGINFDSRGEFMFQQRATAHPPEQDREKLEWISSQQPSEGFPEQVGFDERAVQIHDERD
jgi:hypothetical protein